jgi:L-threonylcarbamoyladenylate synthase
MTRLLKPDTGAIRRAARLLLGHQLVAFPTETVYGLGALASSDRAVRRVFEAKGRPANNPLIVHVASLEGARRMAALDGSAERLALAFWPGPLTLVLPLATGAPVSPLATAGLASVALRAPAHPVAQALLAELGAPIAAPSANPSGRVSPTTAQHVAGDLGDAVALVLDGGPTPVGVESTVVDLTGDRPRMLRPGGVPGEAIEAVVGPLAAAVATGPLRSPGQLASHYAPRLPVRLAAREVAADEALLAFGKESPPGALATRNLSPAGDLREAAANLFAMLRELDRSGARAIAVVPIPERGLGVAINDRLRRAAAR